VRAFGRDRIRAKGIMASGACESRNEGRTHGRTNQRTAAFPKTLANGEPSTHGHVLQVESRVVEWKTKTFRVEHRFFRDGRLAVEGHEVRVWAVPDPTGEKPMRAAPIPPDVVARFTGEEVVSA
jgi:Thioesterase-like superfamily